MMSFFQWVAATMIAAVTGTFALLVFIYSDFTTAREFEEHKKRGHTNVITEKRYQSDQKAIRKELARINDKLDQILLLRR